LPNGSEALRFGPDGAELHAAALGDEETRRIERALAGLPAAAGHRLARLDAIADLLAATGAIGSVAVAHIGAARPVRAILFDKSADANWSLALHQDRTIAVRARNEVAGFGAWTVKAGIPHVEPPHEFTARMATLRLHLDDVDDGNAPLLILPGSHRLGRLTTSQLDDLAETHRPLVCQARRGDIWAYATAIVHGSDSSRDQGRSRRVLQLDYSPDDLPGGLEWHFTNS